jgi:hypothetical protein
MICDITIFSPHQDIVRLDVIMYESGSVDGLDGYNTVQGNAVKEGKIEARLHLGPVRKPIPQITSFLPRRQGSLSNIVFEHGRDIAAKPFQTLSVDENLNNHAVGHVADFGIEEILDVELHPVLWVSVLLLLLLLLLHTYISKVAKSRFVFEMP